MEKMKTISQELDNLRKIAGQAPKITEDYLCGFITASEMMGQLSELNVMYSEECLRVCEEYEINMNGLNLMLQL